MAGSVTVSLTLSIYNLLNDNGNITILSTEHYSSAVVDSEI